MCSAAVLVIQPNLREMIRAKYGFYEMVDYRRLLSVLEERVVNGVEKIRFGRKLLIKSGSGQVMSDFDQTLINEGWEIIYAAESQTEPMKTIPFENLYRHAATTIPLLCKESKPDILIVVGKARHFWDSLEQIREEVKKIIVVIADDDDSRDTLEEVADEVILFSEIREGIICHNGIGGRAIAS